MSQMAKRAWIPIIMVLLIAFVVTRWMSPQESGKKQTFGDFSAQLTDGKVNKVVMDTRSNALQVTLNDSFPRQTEATRLVTRRSTRRSSPSSSRPKARSKKLFRLTSSRATAARSATC